MPTSSGSDCVGSTCRETAPVERRAWVALSVATLAGLLTTIDISIVNVAFPSMRRDLGATEASLSWVLSGYSIASGAFLMLAGRLADQKGRRPSS